MNYLPMKLSERVISVCNEAGLGKCTDFSFKETASVETLIDFLAVGL